MTTEKTLEKAGQFIDPICGITVDPETAAAKYEPGKSS